jgi:Spy/CpxP family protein refolding chaperone
MRRACAIVVVLVVALLVGAQTENKDKEKDKKKEDEPKLKGFLPANFAKLGLTDAQKQRIYKIQADSRAKLAEIEKQKAKLKAEEREAIDAVLTPEQAKELERLRTKAKDKSSKDKEKDKDKAKDQAKDEKK